MPGAIINNNADIYFDLNAPVATNNVFNTIVNPAGISENSYASSFSVLPNPASHSISVLFNNESKGNLNIELIDLSGRKVIKYATQFNNRIELPLNNVNNGIYELKITCGDFMASKKIVVIK